MKKNLLLITESFPFDEAELGFLETEFQELTECFQVTVLTSSKKQTPVCTVPQDVAFYRFEDIRLDPLQLLGQVRHAEVRSEMHRLLPKVWRHATLRQLLDAVAFSARADKIAKQMCKIVEERNIQLIYTYWCTEATLAALRMKNKLPRQLKVVTRFHGYDLYNERRQSGRQPLRAYIAQNADRLFFACERARKYFLRCWPGEWEQRCRVAYLGSQPMPLKTQIHGERLIIASCSNMIPLKRIECIIQSLALLPDNVQAEWHHFGDGTSRQILEKLAKCLLQDKQNVSWHFWGAVAHANLVQRYAMLQPDVFLTTSSTEGGAPVSVQEAMAMGVPAIGTDVGGMAELIRDGVNGYLLPEDVSAQQVCDAIVRFARLKPVQRQAFSRAAVELWEKRFDARRCAAHFVEQMKGLEDGGKT
ncbi:MAG TPA: glycosyltransferase [Candidatus Fournierella pullicola]|uniref:Glycosyltransferase n=1 Tax=Candidatus Allofournierella pullicola TaxID=2838596 RepID=A0A9D1V5N8_9FIRM|nr:glycosyltransferase [Candidatus Fournierella pullicola]